MDTLDIPRSLPENRSKKSAGRILPAIILLALCSVVTFFGKLTTTAAEGKEDWARTIDAYMKAMQARDYRSAYALFSSEARHDFPRSDLEVLGQGPLYALFDGYMGIEITGWEISLQTNGTYAELNGTVTYSGSYRGNFDGILTQVGAEWQLLYINVVAPPEKINAYVMKNS